MKRQIHVSKNSIRLYNSLILPPSPKNMHFGFGTSFNVKAIYNKYKKPQFRLSIFSAQFDDFFAKSYVKILRTGKDNAIRHR